MWLPPELLTIAKGQRRLKLDERQVGIFSPIPVSMNLPFRLSSQEEQLTCFLGVQHLSRCCPSKLAGITNTLQQTADTIQFSYVALHAVQASST